MSLTISAEFTMGTYQGRGPTGAPEPFPEVDRLFAAFTAAAGAGPYAEEVAGGLRISGRHRPALDWMQSNPPDSIFIPDYRFNVPNVTAFRRTGLRSKGKYSQPTSRDAVARSSFEGALTWRWVEAPGPEIVTALEELAAEVAYLGEANSPVLVQVLLDAPLEPEALKRVPETDLFPAGAVSISTPSPGRLTFLEAAYAATRAPGKAERAAALNEEEEQAAWSSAGRKLRWYRHAEAAPSATSAPWVGAVVIEVQAEAGTHWPPRANDQLAWSLALHKALARALDPAAPPIITGHYPPNSKLPANRLAIHIVGQQDPIGWRPSRGIEGSFALLMPAGATAEDQSAILSGVQSLIGRKVYRGRDGAVTLTDMRFVEGREFWRPVADGLRRLFVPRPFVIADTRSQRGARGTKAWGLEEAALLSIGMVWRDLLGLEGKGAAFYHDLVDAMRSRVVVHNPKQVVGQELVRFVHRVNPSNVLTAYTALLEFTNLEQPRAPVALGQSRHLGVGLLVPVDLPGTVFDEDGGLSWA